jgi:hypothetical protein
MLNIRNRVISQLNTTNAQMARFVKLKGQLDTKCASFLRYLGTKNAVNRASDYHYLMLPVVDSTAPVNGIDYIHPVVKPAVDYVTAVINKGLAPNGEINFEFVEDTDADDVAARQSTEMVSRIINEENDPHFILQRWIMDAAMHKNGMLMVLPQREQIVRYVETQGTADQLKAFEQQAIDGGLTPLRQSRRRVRVDLEQVARETVEFAQGLPGAQHEENLRTRLSNAEAKLNNPDAEDEEPGNMELESAEDEITASINRNTIYSAKYKLTGYSLKIKFRNIAQHYWICDPTVQEMKDQVFCGFYDPMSIQEAVHLYPDLNDHLEEFREFAEYNQNGAYQAGSVLNNLAIHARDSVPVQGMPINSGVGADPDSRQVTILTVWDKYDIDGDGEMELCEIVFSGSYILSAKEVEFVPVANMCPKPLPGNFYGMSVAESVISIQEYCTAASRAEIMLGLQSATPRLGVKPDKVDFEMLQDGECAIFVLDAKFDPATDVYSMPGPSGNLAFIDNAMTRMQQDTQALIGMTQPGDVFNPEVMSAGNSGEKLAMALGPNQIIQDNCVRNSADGLKEAIWLVWRTLIQYGDDYGVRKLAQMFHPEKKPVFLDYQAWDDMNFCERKQIHIELALGMLSEENRVARQQAIIQAQTGLYQTTQTMVAAGTMTPEMFTKVKKPYAEILYTLGIKDCNSYLPTDEEVLQMIQQAQEAAKSRQPSPTEQKDISSAKLNDAKTQEVLSNIDGTSAEKQLDYMSQAQGDPKVYN